MKLAYTILEVDRHENANSIRDKVSFMEELKVRICDARKEYPKCIEDYPKFKHIFDSITNIGFIGLWISNLNSFYSLINSDYDALLIFEDDAVLVEDFENKFKLCLKELPQQFGMFSIGYRDLYKSHYSEIHDIGKNNICRMFQSGDSWGILYRKEFVIDLLNTITKYKILGGLPDTAIMSFVLGNLGFKSQYQAYSTTPVLGSLIIHDNDPKNSTIAKSPNTSDYLK